MIGNNQLLSQIMSRQPTTPATAPEYTSYTTPAPAPRPGAGMARGEGMGYLRQSFDPSTGQDALAGVSDTARRAGVSPDFGSFLDAAKFGAGLMGARGLLTSAAKIGVGEAMGLGGNPLDIKNYNTTPGWDQTYRTAYDAAVSQGVPSRQAATQALAAAKEMAIQHEMHALGAAAGYGGDRGFADRGARTAGRAASGPAGYEGGGGAGIGGRARGYGRGTG